MSAYYYVDCGTLIHPAAYIFSETIFVRRTEETSRGLGDGVGEVRRQDSMGVVGRNTVTEHGRDN